jgi:DNA-binding transcriptional LysR family regulator
LFRILDNGLERRRCLLLRPRARGFTAAAKALARPKSSISASVSRLEGELGARLLQRTTRRVRATEAGESLYQDAAPMFQRLRKCEPTPRRAATQSPGGCALPRPTSLARTTSAPCLRDARALSGPAHRHRCRARAASTRSTAATTSCSPYFDGDQPDSGRIARNVFSLARGVFAAPALLEKYPKVKAPQDLAELPAIASPADAEWTFTQDKNIYSVPIRARMRSPNADVRRRATLEGLGVSRIVLTFCEEQVRRKRLQPLLADYACAPLRIHALLPGRRLVPAKVRIFLDLLSAGTPPENVVRP